VAEQTRVVDAFMSALRAGDFEGLIAVLDPDFVIRADATASRSGAPVETRGPETWARGAIQYGQMLRVAQPALVDGAVGLVVAPRGKLVRVLTFTFADGRVASIDVVADPERLARCSIHLLSPIANSDEE
jgi:RNA polymerase sigma-70 factor (ECF subfamily)